MAIIDGNAHVEVAIGILQNLYLNLILLGLELDLVCTHVGQQGGELGTGHCRPPFHVGFQNGSPLFALFHTAKLVAVRLGLRILSVIAIFDSCLKDFDDPRAAPLLLPSLNL